MPPCGVGPSTHARPHRRSTLMRLMKINVDKRKNTCQGASGSTRPRSQGTRTKTSESTRRSGDPEDSQCQRSTFLT
jgi:hypothetical protein